MNNYAFEKYKSYRPGHAEFIILLFGLAVFIMLYIFLFINIDTIFNIFHKFVFGKDGDIIFSLYSGGVFMLSFTFIAIIIAINVLNIPFLFIKKFYNAFFWFKITIEQLKYENNFTYKKYLFRRKITNIFLIALIIVSSFPIFIHLRINNDGLYFTKYLSYKENYYSYDNIGSISVYIEVENRKGISINPKAIIKFGENEQNIWEWYDNPEKIINAINLLRKNGVALNLSNKFNEDIIYALNNNCTQKKRENILRVFTEAGFAAAQPAFLSHD
ncbi:hypothetical protein FACS1894172_10870 [Spirochaetia bacterium]|nr:hypothetical protein FACS1894172_10870 [Spirochaetia bacterium]